MACSVYYQKGDKGNEEMGLVSGHAYSLLSVHMIEDDYDNVIKLVKIRNPHNRGEWNGDWSDDSSLWSEEMADEVGKVDSDDGIFFMAFDDFVNYFTSFTICFFHQFH